MKTYIWFELEEISTRYHDYGGLLIITKNNPLEAWKTYIQNQIASVEEGDDWEIEQLQKLRQILPEPDLVYGCDAIDEKVYVFENSGCC